MAAPIPRRRNLSRHRSPLPSPKATFSPWSPLTTRIRLASVSLFPHVLASSLVYLPVQFTESVNPKGSRSSSACPTRPPEGLRSHFAAIRPELDAFRHNFARSCQRDRTSTAHPILSEHRALPKMFQSRALIYDPRTFDAVAEVPPYHSLYEIAHRATPSFSCASCQDAKAESPTARIAHRRWGEQRPSWSARHGSQDGARASAGWTASPRI